MARKLIIVIGVDCDPDRPRFGGPRYDARRSPLRWRGIAEGILLLQERLQKIENSSGARIKLTLFLRSDAQIEEIYGSAAWPVLEYAEMWRSLEKQGHELAWHPHLWRWNSEWECWFQETRDSEWIGECLTIGHAGISGALGKNPASCHMGWTFHNNFTMRTLSRLGVGIDISACPGVYNEGAPSDYGTRYDNMIDWLGAPRTWYRPSVADYRRPAHAGKAELGIIELPKFTSESGILKKAKNLASRASGGSTSVRSSAAFVQITASPLLYARIIKERMKTEEADPFFVTYFHPDELLPDRPRSARGFLYSLANVEKNLLAIIETARKNGRDIEFSTAAEALQHIFAGCEGGKDSGG